MAEMVGRAEPRSQHAWWQVLVTGIVLFLVGIAVLILTRNPGLIPAVIMLGNFTVPVAFVIFFFERQHLSRLNLPDMMRAFVLGGLLGVFAAGLVEPVFIRRIDILTAFVVGLIEELAKIIGIIVVARHRPHNSELDGLLLGAAAGMGFAALESTGYAFTAFLVSGGSLSAAVGVSLLRGFLAPFGHGTWTAIFASVLFRESAPGPYHINRKVIGAYLLVAILHGLWDGLPGFISLFVTGGPDIVIAELLVAVTSLIILAVRWRDAIRREQKVPEQAPA